MNSDTPLTPRQELEVRLTALLMGELPPEEAAALEAQIAGDAELAALHARLRRATELLREATALPDQPAPPEPARLSSERRERLLAHFKTVTAPIASSKPRRNWREIVPLGLAAALIALIGGGLMMPVFSSVQMKASRVAPRDFAGYGSGEVSSEAKDQWASQPGMVRTRREGAEKSPSAGSPRLDQPTAHGSIGGDRSDRYATFRPPTQSPVALVKSGAGTLTLLPTNTESPPSASSDASLTAFSTVSGTTNQLNESRGVVLGSGASTLARATEPSGSGAGGGGFSGQLTFGGKIELPAGAAGKGDVSEVETRTGDGTLALNGGQLGIQSKSDSPARARPVSSIVGRVGFWSEDSDKDSAPKPADSRVMALGDIPVLGRLFGDKSAAESRPEAAGLATDAKPANAPITEDPRIGNVKVGTRIGGDGGTVALREDKKESLDLNGQVLSGSNTFTGATTINGGTLTIGNGSKVVTSGTISGTGGTAVTAGTLTLNNEGKSFDTGTGSLAANKGAKNNEYSRFENKAGVEAAAAFPMTPTTPTAFETRGAPLDLGNESKPGQVRVDYGMPILEPYPVAGAKSAATPAPSQAPSEPAIRQNVTGNGRTKDKVLRPAKPLAGEQKLKEAAKELAETPAQPARPAGPALEQLREVDAVSEKPMEMAKLERPKLAKRDEESGDGGRGCREEARGAGGDSAAGGADERECLLHVLAQCQRRVVQARGGEPGARADAGTGDRAQRGVHQCLRLSRSRAGAGVRRWPLPRSGRVIRSRKIAICCASR